MRLCGHTKFNQNTSLILDIEKWLDSRVTLNVRNGMETRARVLNPS